MNKSAQWFQKGFTLIELIIVIGVVGILAVGLLATINPIEQINKANDARRISDARDLSAGLDRYYATNGCYPWDAAACGTNTIYGGAVATYTLVTADFTTTATKLYNLAPGKDGEMKLSFGTRTTLTNSELTLYQSAAGVTPLICFTPQSVQYRFGSNPKVTDSTGVYTAATNTCKTATYVKTDLNCRICFPQ